MGTIPLLHKYSEFLQVAVDPNWRATGFTMPGGAEVLEKDENGKWRSREVLI
jgi:hypothetical protein